MHKYLLAVVLILQACIATRGPVDPVFASMRVQYDSQLKSSLTNVESATAQFDGALTGLTDDQKQTPRYRSLVGRYDAILKQYTVAKGKAAALIAWAAQTEEGATLEDRSRLTSEANALSIELGNLGATVHQLPAEINVIQMTTH